MEEDTLFIANIFLKFIDPSGLKPSSQQHDEACAKNVCRNLFDDCVACIENRIRFYSCVLDLALLVCVLFAYFSLLLAYFFTRGASAQYFDRVFASFTYKAYARTLRILARNWY